MSAVVDWLIAVCVTIHTGRPPLRDHARHAQFNQEKFVRKISPWHVNRGAWAHRPHFRSVDPVDAETDVSRPGRQHPRLPSLGIPSILGRAQPPQPPTKPDRCTRAIEAFSNFRSVEAPGWTGGIRFQRRRHDARTSVQWKPLLTTTCAWQLSLSLSAPGHRQRQRRRLHDFQPKARSVSAETKCTFVFSFLSAFCLSTINATACCALLRLRPRVVKSRKPVIRKQLATVVTTTATIS